MAVVIGAYVLVLGLSFTLKALNLRHLRTHGAEVPPELAAVLEPLHLRRMATYTYENSRLGTLRTAVDSILLLVFLFGGLLGVFDRWIMNWQQSLVGHGIAFFLLLYFAESLISVPFSLYRNFRIESRFGFNAMTPRLWLSDFMKTLLVSTILLTAATAGALALVHRSPDWWWLWVWLFLALLGLFVMYVSPYVIEPLFFKLEPLRNQVLREQIHQLMRRAGVRVQRVFQVDASRRSRHSNAYFTGFGRVKRIVLFDTLLEQMGENEILAVLAHETGHWKKRHVLKRLCLIEACALLALFGTFHLQRWQGLADLVGLQQASFPARILVVGFLGSMVLFVLTPLFSFLSRCDEREADRFASELTGRPGDLAQALAKLSRENLANLHPHPTYAWFYYSHPPAVERIRALSSTR